MRNKKYLTSKTIVMFLVFPMAVLWFSPRGWAESESESAISSSQGSTSKEPKCLQEMSSGGIRTVTQKLLMDLLDKKVLTGQIQKDISEALGQYKKNLRDPKKSIDRQCLLAFLYNLNEKVDTLGGQEIMADWFNQSGFPMVDLKTFKEDLRTIHGNADGAEFANKVVKELRAFSEGD